MFVEVSNTKKHFYAIGVSYLNADLKTRGDFSLSLTQKDSLTLEAKRKGIEEILITSTCNYILPLNHLPFTIHTKFMQELTRLSVSIVTHLVCTIPVPSSGT